MYKTPPARLQPVQAWAIVDRKGRLADLPDYFALYADWEDVARVMARLDPKRAAKYHVVRVTVRAWAPPKQKQVTR